MRGGARVGAGRPKAEETVAVRVPVGCLDAVRALISSYRETGSVACPDSALVDLQRQVEFYRRESEMCQAERSSAFKAARIYEERLLAAGLSIDLR